MYDDGQTRERRVAVSRRGPSSIAIARGRRSPATLSAFPAQLHPVVVPHVMHLRHVPFLTIVNWPQSRHGSPS